ncbi:MAG: hypothetical protein ABI787_04550 [Spartobacteria bacterium]
MKPLSSTPRLAVSLSLLTAALLVGVSCDQNSDKITVYRVPKEAPPEPISQGAAPATGAPVAVHWTAPSGWEEQPASGFRKGSFLVRDADGKTADVSVISFPEAAGGLLANVNRWRDQLKLAPISDVVKAGTPISVAGRDLFFVDLVSEQPIGADGSKTRILGGVFPSAGETWFFKMMGPAPLVETQREAFKQFLQSVHPGDHATGEEAALTTPAAPMSANDGGETNAPTPPPIESAQGGALQYKLPPGWQEKPLSPMRLASFKAGSSDGKEVDVSIVTLPGMAGGDLANVNRWRGQVKLAPIDEETLAKSAEHVQAQGHDYQLYDLASETPLGEKQEKERILAAILNENGHSWFIKMTGEEAAVAAQKSAFLDFLRGLTIP